MGDLRMSESFSVKSNIRDYYLVQFVDNLQGHLAILGEQKNVIFIIDKNVHKLFLQEFKIIENSRLVLIDPSEKFKTIDYSQEIIRELINTEVRKDDILVAIGGGITQDIVAFISSILFRGVEWRFFPTTLLAQCDSCIGSKSSINFDQFKNLLGTFNPPSEIFIYSGFLTTLSDSEIRSGIGEMLHYFFTKGIDSAQEIADNFDKLLVDRSLLKPFISESLKIKKEIIEKDEFDTSIRHIFNYGHTFGHAIEAITDYEIPHGQAISIGMDLANYISLNKGMITNAQFDEMHSILKMNIPPFKLTKDNIEQYLQALSKDKKNKGALLGCILTFGAGKVEKVFLNMDESLKSIMISYSDTYLVK
ncbi:MAG: 3-dehydroquinate synthase [Ignavibacteria bacterium]|nr:3-dehydroquinate synthase [Ignavibacteria bacterium]